LARKTPIVQINHLRNRALRRLKWRAYRWLRRPSVVCDHPFGYRIRLESSDVSAHQVYFGYYEAEETERIFELVQPGMTVLDVGAYIGYFTLLMAVRVGPQGKVYAFEPNPNMYRRLIGNLALNAEHSDGRVVPQQVALSAHDGEAEFFCPIDGLEGVGGLRDTKRAPVASVKRVPIRTLDGFVERERMTKVDFIKMDIEGGELDALRGAEGMLSTMRPTILFEACELNTAPYGYRVFEILDHLEQRDYVVKQAGMMGQNFLATPR
jgi:FkbM family methyltransferase